MNSDYIKNLEASQMKTEVADFAVGDTVKVHNKIKEGNRERIQISKELLLRDRVEATERLSQLESSQTVLAQKDMASTFTIVEKIEVVRHGKVRRAKIYYLRSRVGKAAKVKELVK